MQNRPWTFIALTAALAMPFLAASVPAQSQSGANSANRGDVVVDLTNLRNTKGTVRACMTNDPELFPRCRDDASSYRLTVPAGEAQTLRFRNVAPGTYAIALLHDENDNGRADRALTMIPREGFGFSRDAPVSMGPPDFDDAAITVGRASQRQPIRMRYML